MFFVLDHLFCYKFSMKCYLHFCHLFTCKWSLICSSYFCHLISYKFSLKCSLYFCHLFTYKFSLKWSLDFCHLRIKYSTLIQLFTYSATFSLKCFRIFATYSAISFLFVFFLHFSGYKFSLKCSLFLPQTFSNKISTNFKMFFCCCDFVDAFRIFGG